MHSWFFVIPKKKNLHPHGYNTRNNNRNHAITPPLIDFSPDAPPYYPTFAGTLSSAAAVSAAPPSALAQGYIRDLLKPQPAAPTHVPAYSPEVVEKAVSAVASAQAAKVAAPCVPNKDAVATQPDVDADTYGDDAESAFTRALGRTTF